MKQSHYSYFRPCENGENLLHEDFAVPNTLECSLRDAIVHGDSQHEMSFIKSESVDLVVTSPPYADSRKKTYGGIHPDNYVEWFLPFSQRIYDILNPRGSFVLNIKEKVVDGERHPYVLNLIIEMRKQGWLWTEEYIWHKKNCYPGKWPNRFRDAWERCLHFTKNKNFHMNQDAVMVPMGNWKNTRLRNLSKTDKVRDESRVESGFGKRIENWVGREYAYPTNVLYLATECSNRSHSATFPLSLPSWFIKLFTKAGDLVLDPFVGSGTTAIAAALLHRHFIGIDQNSEYCELTRQSLASLRTNQLELSLPH
jgi:DNA modification methylase